MITEVIIGALPDLSIVFVWDCHALTIHLGLHVRNFFSKNDELILVQVTILVGIGLLEKLCHCIHESWLTAILLHLVSGGL